MDAQREEKKQGWAWDGEGMEGEQKHLGNKQRDTHKNILTNFSQLNKTLQNKQQKMIMLSADERCYKL